ncbi:MAG: glycosyl hydrolase, partial [Woeseiaceae bacterium]
MIIRSLIVATLLAARVASADFGEYRNHALDGQSLVVESDLGNLVITPLDDAAFEVHYRESGVKQLPSFAIDRDNTSEVMTALSESETTLAFMIDGLTAVIEKAPIKVRFMKDGQPLVAEEHGYFAFETTRGFRFKLDAGEKILGGGQRVMGMDRRGKRMPLYNKASYGYETEAAQMYYSVPAVMSSDKYTIVFDNSASGWLDIGSTESDVLKFEAVGGRTAYIVIAGDTYPALIENYTDVTGKQPMPPRWAFGNYASRFGYHSEKEARDVVRR